MRGWVSRAENRKLFLRIACRAAERTTRRSCAALLPEKATMAEAAAWMERQEDLVSYVKSLDFPLDYLHPEYHSVLLDGSLISRLARLGVGVSPYTPDKPEELKALYRAGCYSIITNRPDILLELRKAEG